MNLRTTPCRYSTAEVLESRIAPASLLIRDSSGELSAILHSDGASEEELGLAAYFTDSGTLHLEETGALSGDALRIESAHALRFAGSALSLASLVIDAPSVHGTISAAGSVVASHAAGISVDAALFAGTSIAVLSDGTTTFAGSLTAPFVETSGARLVLTGVVHAGTWLLDPNNVLLQRGVSANSSGLTPTDDNSIIDIGLIEAALNAGTSVIIETSTAGANTQTGIITVADTINKSAGAAATLTLRAHAGITFLNLDGDIEAPGITNTGGSALSLVLNPDFDSTGDGSLAAAAGTVWQVQGDLLAGGGAGAGGAITSTAGPAVLLQGLAATIGGSFSLQASAGDGSHGVEIRNSSINVQGASLTITASATGGTGDGLLLSSSTLGSTGATVLSLGGTSAGGQALRLTGFGTVLGGGSGAITLAQATVELAFGSVQTTGLLTFSTSASVGLGVGAGVLQLTQAELGRIANGTAGIAFGSVSTMAIVADGVAARDQFLLTANTIEVGAGGLAFIDGTNGLFNGPVLLKGALSTQNQPLALGAVAVGNAITQISTGTAALSLLSLNSAAANTGSLTITAGALTLPAGTPVGGIATLNTLSASFASLNGGALAPDMLHGTGAFTLTSAGALRLGSLTAAGAATVATTGAGAALRIDGSATASALTLRGADFILNGAPGSIQATLGSLVLAPSIAGLTVGLGGAPGAVQLSAAELATLRAQVGGVRIGDALTGAITVGDATMPAVPLNLTSFSQALTLQGTSIALAQPVTYTPAATLALLATSGAVTQGAFAGASITMPSGGGELRLTGTDARLTTDIPRLGASTLTGELALQNGSRSLTVTGAVTAGTLGLRLPGGNLVVSALLATTTGDTTLEAAGLRFDMAVSGPGTLRLINPNPLLPIVLGEDLNNPARWEIAASSLDRLADGFLEVRIGGPAQTTLTLKNGGWVTRDPMRLEVAPATDPALGMGGGDIQLFTSLAAQGNGGWNFQGARLLVAGDLTTAAGDIRTRAALILDADTTWQSTLGDMVLDGKINSAPGGAHAFTADSLTGRVELRGNWVDTPSGISIGGEAALSTLTLKGDSLYLQPSVRTLGTQSYTGATIEYRGAHKTVTQQGRIEFHGDVTLDGSYRLTTPGGVGDDVIFTGSLNGNPLLLPGSAGLTINAGTQGTVSFDDVGDTTPLGRLEIVKAASTTFNGEIGISGKLIINSTVNFTGGPGSFDGGTLDLRSAGPILIGGVSPAATLSQADLNIFGPNATVLVTGVSGAFTLEAGTNFDAATFRFQAGRTQTITIAGDLTANQADVSVLGTKISLGGDLTVTGSGSLVLQTAAITGDTTLDAGTGRIEITGAVTTPVANVRGLVLQADLGGVVKIGGAAGTTLALQEITSSGAGQVELGGGNVLDVDLLHTGSTALRGAWKVRDGFSAPGAVQLSGLTSITTSLADITIGDVDGASGLTLIAKTASVTVGDLGITTPLKGVTLTAARNVLAGEINATATTLKNSLVAGSLVIGAVQATGKTSITGFNLQLGTALEAPVLVVEERGSNPLTFQGSLLAATVASFKAKGVLDLQTSGAAERINLTAPSITIDHTGDLRLGTVAAKTLLDAEATGNITAIGKVTGLGDNNFRAGGNLEIATVGSKLTRLAEVIAGGSATLLLQGSTAITGNLSALGGDLILAANIGTSRGNVSAIATATLAASGDVVVYGYSRSRSTGLGDPDVELVGAEYPTRPAGSGFLLVTEVG